MPKGAAIESWNVGLGGSVSSSTALATIDFPRDLVAEALVTQADISSLKVGQKAALTIDGETSDPFTATITSISSQPASSSSSGSSSSTAEYTVDLAPAQPAVARQVGHDRLAHRHHRERSNVLLVPTSAVSGSSSASFVRVMLNGTPTYRQVTTGMATSSLTQITSGLTAGEVVVTGTYTNSASSTQLEHEHRRLRRPRRSSGGGSFRRSSSGGCLQRAVPSARRPMIVALESLRMALASLRANPLRAVLTILGIVIGVAAVVALTSIGSGSTRAVENRFNAFGTDTITVESSPLREQRRAPERQRRGRHRRHSRRQGDRHLGQHQRHRHARLQQRHRDDQRHLAADRRHRPPHRRGRHLLQRLRRRPRACRWPCSATRWPATSTVSPLRAVGQTVNLGGVQFQVIGVLAAQGGVGFASVDSSVLVPLGSIEGQPRRLSPRHLADPRAGRAGAVNSFQAAVESTLRTQHDLTSSEQDDFQIVNASSIASAVSSSTKTLTRLMAAIAAISLVVGGIGVANVMLVTVRERTREIGVRRAVGRDAARHRRAVPGLRHRDQRDRRRPGAGRWASRPPTSAAPP